MIDNLFETLGEVLGGRGYKVEDEPVTVQVTFKNLTEYGLFLALMSTVEQDANYGPFTIERVGGSDDG
tara:strand:- start:570 stop:773 length:204 start_codon:yes stop_codon:yes gene_type:complete